MIPPATDSDPDRTKMWEEDHTGAEYVVYDNGFEEALGGGSVVIHTGGGGGGGKKNRGPMSSWKRLGRPDADVRAPPESMGQRSAQDRDTRRSRRSLELCP